MAAKTLTGSTDSDPRVQRVPDRPTTPADTPHSRGEAISGSTQSTVPRLLAATAAGAALTLLEGNVAIISGTILFVLAGWAVTLCLHEFGHAAVAYKGGDFSVRDKGYLTLDIRRYTDPVLSIVLPLILLAIGGIPLPGGAVWINHHALRSKKIESLVSLAGPTANLVIGVLLTRSSRSSRPRPRSPPRFRTLLCCRCSRSC